MLSKPPNSAVPAFAGLSCSGCPLQHVGTGFTRPWLGGDVLIVGEAPAASEIASGWPFVGASGRLLNLALYRMGAKRPRFTIWNVMACRPPGDKVVAWPGAVAHCRQYLLRVISVTRPKVIVCMGNTALEQFVPALRRRTKSFGEGLDPKLHGIVNKRAPKCGYYFPAEIYLPNGVHRCWVTSSPHPAALLRGLPGMTAGVLIEFLARALRAAREGFRYTEQHYVTRPDETEFRSYIEEARAFIAGHRRKRLPTPLWLAADIETEASMAESEDEIGGEGMTVEERKKLERELKDMSKILVCMSFCFIPGQAITAPATPAFMALFVELLSLAWDAVVGWNWHPFDIERLRKEPEFAGGKNGVVSFAGLPSWLLASSPIFQFDRLQVDLMPMWCFLQSDLRMGLGFVAPWFCDLPEWKTESGTRPEWYACTDPDATLRNAFGIREKLIEEGRWERF